MPKTKHGMRYTKFYEAWRGIRQRCNNKNNRNYHHYGGRGIKVCKHWDDFISFKNDMYKDFLKHIKKYGEKATTIDRIDNNGHYCKKNCRWATMKQQSNNTRTNRYITYKYKTQTLTMWSEELNINYNKLYKRLKRGWSIHKTFIN